MKIAVLTAVAATLAGAAGAQDREPRSDVVRAAAQSVVRVLGDGCMDATGARTGARAGSGFVWPEAGQVITALHVVADCERLSVEYVDAGLQREARLSRSLKRADLVLLEVIEAPAARPLTTSETMDEEEALAAIGLPLNIRGWQETYGRRTARPLGPLDDILNERAREEIRNLGVPDLQLEIFRLDAVVKPGSSGGPVINRRGEVVGVVNGGLDGGSSALNWAIPSRYLPELRRDGESGPLASLGPAAQQVFSYSVASETSANGGAMAALGSINDEIRCGGRSYFKLASRTVGEIVGSLADLSEQGVLDDPAGFIGMVQLFSAIIPAEQIMALRYDLLVDVEIGATIAIPWGARLDDYDEGCVAVARDSDVHLAFQSRRLGGLVSAQAASLEFERLVGEGYGFMGCQPDPALMELVPHVRFDGLVGRRQGAYCWTGSDAVPAYAIVAYLARGDDFAGVVAINEDYGSTGPGGDPVVTRDWIAAAIAVLLSTFQL